MPRNEDKREFIENVDGYRVDFDIEERPGHEAENPGYDIVLGPAQGKAAGFPGILGVYRIKRD